MVIYLSWVVLCYFCFADTCGGSWVGWALGCAFLVPCKNPALVRAQHPSKIEERPLVEFGWGAGVCGFVPTLEWQNAVIENTVFAIEQEKYFLKSPCFAGMLIEA